MILNHSSFKRMWFLKIKETFNIRGKKNFYHLCPVDFKKHFFEVA